MAPDPTDVERVVVVQNHGAWSAHFADQPGWSYGGRCPDEAIRRLLAAHPERAVSAEPLAAIDEATGDDHQEFVIPRIPRSPCPDCRGTGRYVGLQMSESCTTCGGRGYSRP